MGGLHGEESAILGTKGTLNGAIVVLMGASLAPMVFGPAPAGRQHGLSWRHIGIPRCELDTHRFLFVRDEQSRYKKGVRILFSPR